MTETERAPKQALIDLDGVDVEIDGAPILHAIHWRLEPRQHWGVVGANGSGKSTFLALLAGIRWPAPGRGTRTYRLGRGPERDAVAARREIALIGHELQDRYTRLDWNFKADDVVLSGVFKTDVPRQRATPAERTRAHALLHDVGLAHVAERRFLELSRGEQRRVLIARALAFEPRVLLLDEPVSGLDAASRLNLYATLARVAERAQLVITAHAKADLLSVVTHVLELDGGSISACGAALPALQPPAAEPAPRPPRPVEPRSPAASAAALIDVRRADVWLGGRHVLHGIDWCLGDGEHWLVTGSNGAGKSSFLRLLHGQLRPAVGGRIRWPALGDPSSVWDLRRRVAWVSPELQAGYRYRATVRNCVASGFDSSLGLVRSLRPHEQERVDVLLERFDLASLASRLLTELSYGQLRRALLARALVHRPRVLLLDEPWEGLDRRVARLLARQLEESIAEGTQLVCASHLPLHESVYTHELVLERGAIVEAAERRAAPSVAV